MDRYGSIAENELAEMCGKGLQAAQDELYRRYAPGMFAICRRYCGNTEDAEDLLHDGFIKIFRTIRCFRYQGAGSLKGWMGRIFVNEAVSRLRQKARKDIKAVRADNQDIPSDDSGDDIPILEAIPPETLMEMISGLPDGCRSVLNLYVFEQKSHKEIAKILGIKENSSTSQLHRAKRILKTRLDALWIRQTDFPKH